jgi:uncharacterized protein YkwD
VLHPVRSVLLVFGLASTLYVGLLAGTPASASTATSLEAAMLRYVNATRVVHGLRALPVNGDLTYYAHKQALAMAGRHALYHANMSSICCYWALAQNVGYGSTLVKVHLAFLRSAGHRANILNPRWDGAGMGVVSSGGYLWVTEDFRDHR